MSTITIAPGQLVRLDPSDKVSVTFDWDSFALAPAATIVTSTFTIAAIKQNGLTLLTMDNPVILAGDRTTKVRLLATTATAKDHYEVANKITTNESPAQEFERSFHVLIENQ